MHAVNIPHVVLDPAILLWRVALNPVVVNDQGLILEPLASNEVLFPRGHHMVGENDDLQCPALAEALERSANVKLSADG